MAISVSGDEIPEEEVLVDAVREALGRGTAKINILNGFTVRTDSTVQVVTGPVLGEVSTDTANLLLEVC